VSPGGRHLERPAGLGLASDLGEIDRKVTAGKPGTPTRHSFPPGSACPCASPSAHVFEWISAAWNNAYRPAVSLPMKFLAAAVLTFLIGALGSGHEGATLLTPRPEASESVAAFEPVAVIGGSGGGAGKLGIPLGVATDGAGGLYATEHVNQRVSRFTTAGEFAQAWGFDVMPGGGEGFEVCTRVTGCRPGEPGGRAGQLGFPGGIAVDTGNVYVTDPANDRVSQFTNEGAFVLAFGYDVVPGGGKGFEICTQATGCKAGIAGAQAGQLAGPSYVVSDGVGSIFVTDQATIRVNQFTDAGAFVRAWGFDVVPGGGEGFEICTQATGCKRGEPGGRAGQLSFPTGIAAVGGGLYVADGNSRISQFTTEGSFVRAFGYDVVPGGGQGFEICTLATHCTRGTSGGAAGQLSSFVLGVGADAAGNVYVAESGNSRVSQFTTEGSFVRAFGRDVVPGGADGFEICTQATGCKRGRSRGDSALPFPSAVAADPGGALYVTDVDAGRILCLGEPGSTPCVRNLFGFSDLRLDRSRGTASLGVKVPGPGELRLRGKGVKSVQRHPEAAGVISLPIRPRSGTRRVLNLEGKARVQVRVTYEPTNGGPHTKTKRIGLRKRR
jgi:DNA-binding beta-propeller fold protein YncE